MMEQLPYERTMVGVGAVAAMQEAVEITVQYAKERKMFGKTLFDLQNTRFKLAECKTQAHVGRIFLDNCIENFVAGRRDDITIAMAKYWLSDVEFHVVDECLQLHGGYGYLKDFPIERYLRDLRVHQILEGTNEVMRLIVSRDLLGN